MVTNGAFIQEAITVLHPYDVSISSLWRDRIRLEEAFYEALLEHPLPLRDATLREISGSSLAIDLYIWLAYRLHVLVKPVQLPWPALHRQFGAGYKEVCFFRKYVRPPLNLALAVYPEARVDIFDQEGLVLYPSEPPVPEQTKYYKAFHKYCDN